MQFAEPVLVTDEVLDALEALTPLAPLHQPGSLGGLRRLAVMRPDLPQIACFDTAFHRTQPEIAAWLGLPRDLHERGVRRYGFHGLNYEHVADRLGQTDPRLARGRVIAAHLGAGASLCALKAGKSVDTTMGFSPLDGLMMATRSGTLDPGAVLYLLQHEGLSADQAQDLLYRRSGLLGVSGVSGDMRTLLASDRAEAREAVAVFVYRAAREAAALIGVLEGLDGIVFTGGIGEHSPQVRAMIAGRLAWTGLTLDPALNARAGEGRISAEDSKVAAWVIPADEERIIARHTPAGPGPIRETPRRRCRRGALKPHRGLGDSSSGLNGNSGSSWALRASEFHGGQKMAHGGGPIFDPSQSAPKSGRWRAFLPR